MFGEMCGSNVWGIVRDGKYPGKTSREKCWNPHAGLQVCTYSGYDLCYPGYIAYRRTQSDRLTDRERDRQLMTGYTISSASGANKNSKHAMLMISFIMCMTFMLYESVSNIIYLIL